MSFKEYYWTFKKSINLINIQKVSFYIILILSYKDICCKNMLGEIENIRENTKLAILKGMGDVIVYFCNNLISGVNLIDIYISQCQCEVILTDQLSK